MYKKITLLAPAIPSSKMKVAQSCPTLCNPMGYIYSPWNSPGQNTGVGSPIPSPRDLPNSGIEPGSPALQADFFYQRSHKGRPLKLTCYKSTTLQKKKKKNQPYNSKDI